MVNTPEQPNPGCQICSSPTGDGGGLCRTHTDDLRRDLRELLPHSETRVGFTGPATGPRHLQQPVTGGVEVEVPGIIADLEVTITRQARSSAEKHGGRSSTTPLPWQEHASVKAFELNTTVNAWALDTSKLGEDDRDPLKDIPHTDTAGVTEWLVRNLSTLRQHPEVGTAYDELTDAVTEARRAVDKPPEKLFAGRCGSTGDDENPHDPCPEDLYGVPGKQTVTCKCGAQHDMAKRREWMLGCIEDQVTYSGLLAGLVSNLGVQIASSTIRKYASAGRIKAISVDSKRRPLYRIGDVLDVFLKRAA